MLDRLADRGDGGARVRRSSGRRHRARRVAWRSSRCRSARRPAAGRGPCDSASRPSPAWATTSMSGSAPSRAPRVLSARGPPGRLAVFGGLARRRPGRRPGSGGVPVAAPGRWSVRLEVGAGVDGSGPAGGIRLDVGGGRGRGRPRRPGRRRRRRSSCRRTSGPPGTAAEAGVPNRGCRAVRPHAAAVCFPSNAALPRVDRARHTRTPGAGGASRGAALKSIPTTRDSLRRRPRRQSLASLRRLSLPDAAAGHPVFRPAFGTGHPDPFRGTPPTSGGTGATADPAGFRAHGCRRRSRRRPESSISSALRWISSTSARRPPSSSLRCACRTSLASSR